MKFIVIGCGRMGAGLTLELERRGHLVTVVDHQPAALEALASGFRGRALVGIGFDRELLLEAGVEQADGLAAVTNSDETNVVVARVAREFFRVPRVVARLYDPRKAEVYRKLGLETISTTAWGINRVADLLGYGELDVVMNLGSEVELVELEVGSAIAGHLVGELGSSGEFNVVALRRANRSFLPTPKTPLESGDRLHVVVLARATQKLETLLGLKEALQ
jgi:trk system potassium uptake protein